MRKKLISLITTSAMTLSLFTALSITASAAGESEDNPIEISTAAELSVLASEVNSGDSKAGVYYKLTANIDLGGSNNPWTPIGDYSSYGSPMFKGSFNGDGHTISGLYINAEDNDYQGLFGYLGSGGAIKNLGVDGTVIGCLYIGGVCGSNYNGTITNCYNTGAISGTRNYVGGVCGAVYRLGIITNCCNSGAIACSGSNTGGICGLNNSSTVTKCCNTGGVSGVENIGGVCGQNTGTIADCRNTGEVNGAYVNVGGICGYNIYTIMNCCSVGTITCSDYVGGVCGYNYGGTVTGCYYLDGTAPGGINGADGVGAAEVKTAEEFESGEIAYLLRRDRTETLMWGQSLNCDSADTYPVLTNDNEKKVYKVVFKVEDSETDELYQEYAAVYTNYNGTVVLPAAPVSDEYEFKMWSVTANEGGAEFTAETRVSEDMTVYAVFNKNAAADLKSVSRNVGTQEGDETENKSTATGFITTVTNNGNENASFNSIQWSVTSQGKTNMSGIFTIEAVTLEPNASVSIGLIVNGLKDDTATAEAVME